MYGRVAVLTNSEIRSIPLNVSLGRNARIKRNSFELRGTLREFNEFKFVRPGEATDEKISRTIVTTRRLRFLEREDTRKTPFVIALGLVDRHLGLIFAYDDDGKFARYGV